MIWSYQKPQTQILMILGPYAVLLSIHHRGRSRILRGGTHTFHISLHLGWCSQVAARESGGMPSPPKKFPLLLGIQTQHIRVYSHAVTVACNVVQSSASTASCYCYFPTTEPPLHKFATRIPEVYCMAADTVFLPTICLTLPCI